MSRPGHASSIALNAPEELEVRSPALALGRKAKRGGRHERGFGYLVAWRPLGFVALRGENTGDEDKIALNFSSKSALGFSNHEPPKRVEYGLVRPTEPTISTRNQTPLPARAPAPG